MFCLKLLKICLNTNLKFIVFDVCSCANIEYRYNLFIEEIKISCLNVKAVSKKSF